MSYNLCEKVFDLFKIPKVCMCKELGLEGKCCGDLERHHKDLNPFNNNPSNLGYLCKSHHKMEHDLLPAVNMVDTYNESVDAAGFEDDDKKYAVMVGVLMSKLNEVKSVSQEVHASTH